MLSWLIEFLGGWTAQEREELERAKVELVNDNAALRVAVKLAREDGALAKADVEALELKVASLQSEIDANDVASLERSLTSYTRNVGESEVDFLRRRAVDLDALRGNRGIQALLCVLMDAEDRAFDEWRDCQGGPEAAELLRQRAKAMHEARRLIVTSVNQLKLEKQAQERSVAQEQGDWDRFRKLREAVDTAGSAS